MFTFFCYLEHGADLTATNNEGYTALSLAVGVGNKNGKCYTVVFLLRLNWSTLCSGAFHSAKVSVQSV